MDPYYKDYPGTWGMKMHDLRADMVRWFDNYVLNKWAMGPMSTEWMTIEEVSFTRRSRRITRYIGTIGADHHDRTRTVMFETNAPPPPTFMQPVKTKYAALCSNHT